MPACRGFREIQGEEPHDAGRGKGIPSRVTAVTMVRECRTSRWPAPGITFGFQGVVFSKDRNEAADIEPSANNSCKRLGTL